MEKKELKYCITEVNYHSVIIAHDIRGDGVKELESLLPFHEKLVEMARKEFTSIPNLKGLLMNFIGEPFVIARIY